MPPVRMRHVEDEIREIKLGLSRSRDDRADYALNKQWDHWRVMCGFVHPISFGGFSEDELASLIEEAYQIPGVVVVHIAMVDTSLPSHYGFYMEIDWDKVPTAVKGG